jgi:DNA replication and repair protein RecF
MNLKTLSIINFKNYEQADINFSPKINCFVGNNGVGKTNLLDAIYYLSFCKSSFNPIDSQNIMNNEEFFLIQGQYTRKETEEHIYCGLKKGQKKQFKRNKKEYPRLADHIGFIPLVMKSPADINFIYDGSEERRRFLDSVISQFDHAYLDDLMNYNKILSQRNKLLKNVTPEAYIDTFGIYNDQLNSFGTRIYNKRSEFVKELVPIFQEFFNEISEGRESVALEYNSQLQNENLQELLQSSFRKDCILQYTTRGIHKDDLNLTISNQPLKKYGSQGQQKTFLVALKFAQYDFIRNQTSLKPLLLLDDIFDKLDRQRVAQIIKLVTHNHFGQIFITDTSPDRLRNILGESTTDHKIFSIEDGNIIE